MNAGDLRCQPAIEIGVAFAGQRRFDFGCALRRQAEFLKFIDVFARPMPMIVSASSAGGILMTFRTAPNRLQLREQWLARALFLVNSEEPNNLPLGHHKVLRQPFTLFR
jgi:hypothetical protein